jgi:VanZ family protein
MLPAESGFSIPQFDKIVHISLFGGFVLFWNLFFYFQPAISSRRLLLLFFIIFILGNAYGIGMEFVQKCCIPMRDFDEADIIADMIGAGIAYGISHIWLIKPERRSY